MEKEMSLGELEQVKMHDDHENEIRQLLDSQQYELAVTKIMSLIAKDPLYVPYYVFLGSAKRSMGLADDVIPVLEKATSLYPQLALYRSENYRRHQEHAITLGLPSIFLNTQFKSGSVFLRGVLEQGLSMPWQFLNVEGVTSRMVPAWLQDFSRGGVICQQHRIFNEELKASMEKFPDAKLVIHLRDPRQSALSAVHHFESVMREGPDYARRNLIAEMPKGYETWTLYEKLELFLGITDDVDYSQGGILFLTGRLFSAQVKWIDRWLQAIEENDIPLEIILTDYQDLADGQRVFMEKLLDKLAIPQSLFNFDVVKDRPKPGEQHYRKGDPNEWRRVLTEQQQQHAYDLMTDRLRKRYS